jgi:hypothetical protein
LPASIESWEKAISTIPDNPSSAEQKLKSQAELALKSAEEAQHKFERQSKKDHNVLEMRNTGSMPRDVAATMIAQWKRDGTTGDPSSSAWLVYEADMVCFHAMHLKVW